MAGCVAVAGILLTGCSTALPIPTTAATSPSALPARSLHLPSINPAAQGCPVTIGTPAHSLGPFDGGELVGPGPVYALTAGPSPATAALPFYAVANGWHYAKVPFFARPGYQGPVVIRGARIDGAGLVRFDGHPNLVPSLELTSADGVFHPGAGWRGWATGVLVRSRGCYALQIDGSPFSTVVVFLALVDVPPSPLAHRVSGGCGSTTVYKGGPPGWLDDAVGGAANAPTPLPYFSSPSGLIGGFVFGYPLRAGKPDNPTNKILWGVATARNGSALDIEAHPQGAAAPSVTYSFPDDSSPGEIYPSIVDVPSPGCWSFTLHWGTAQAEVQLAFV
jgi:hypothetical protein